MLISYEQEMKLCLAFVERFGMSGERAVRFSEAITQSDFTGVYTHGLERLINYIKRFRSGAMDAAAEVKLIREDAATSVFDCGLSDGISAVNFVYDDVLRRAKEYGVAVGVGMNGENIGCGNYYGRRAARDGVIALVCCNTVTSVVPYGGIDKIMGTNPIIFGAPAGEEAPVVLDISTSIVAFGKVMAAAREGKSIPEGWALTADGEPTTDAKAANAVFPFGTYKGYGLAVAVDIMSAVLSGALYGRAVGDPKKNERANTGFAVAIIDIGRFMPIDRFKADMDVYIRSIRESRPMRGTERVLLPGQLEAELYRKYLAEGCNVSDKVCGELAAMAAELGMAPEGTNFMRLIENL